MAIVIGSARVDENGKYSGGKAGDQKQKSSTNDTRGEVSMQNFYVHSKGWYIYRLKDAALAAALASTMKAACNNSNIGYSQSQRTGVNSKGTKTTTPTNSDCSSLVRQCIKEATGKDPGNFTTDTEPAALDRTGLFEARKKYVSATKTPIYNGDVLVTCSKGHTVIVVSGSPRSKEDKSKYYPAYTGTSVSIATALRAVGEKDNSYTHRKKIAAANGITNYSGTATQNTQMLKLLKAGKLIKA